VPVQCLDVGGGLSVDYEGTRSRSYFSMNYGLRDYAWHIVHTIQELCDADGVRLFDDEASLAVLDGGAVSEIARAVIEASGLTGAAAEIATGN
jgi:hypothetical protein